MDDRQEEDRGGDGIERIGVDARAQHHPQAGAWQVRVAGERQGERRDDLGLKHWEVREKGDGCPLYRRVQTLASAVNSRRTSCSSFSWQK